MRIRKSQTGSVTLQTIKESYSSGRITNCAWSFNVSYDRKQWEYPKCMFEFDTLTVSSKKMIKFGSLRYFENNQKSLSPDSHAATQIYSQNSMIHSPRIEFYWKCLPTKSSNFYFSHRKTKKKSKQNKFLKHKLLDAIYPNLSASIDADWAIIHETQ